MIFGRTRSPLHWLLAFALAWLACARANAAPDTDKASDSDPSETTGAFEEHEQIENDLEELLAKHRFCSDEDYRLPFDERHLCELADAAKARCPGVAKACENPLTNQDQGFRLSLDWLHLERFAEIFRLVFWSLVVLLVTLVAFMIVRRLITTEATRDQGPNADPDALDEDGSPAPVVTGETDVQRLLEQARRAAAVGDFHTALFCGYSALLRQLDKQGLIEIHRSKTNGDYRRSLGKVPAIQQQFAHVVRALEGIQFGHQPATEATYRSVLERVVSVVSQAIVLVVLLGASLCSMGCSDYERPQAASALGCGETPGGYSVLCEMLAAQNAQVRRRIRKLDKIEADVSTLIVLDDASLNEQEWKTLDEWASAGHTLVLAQVPSPLAGKLQVTRSAEPCREPPELDDSLADYYGHEAQLAAINERALRARDSNSWVLVACDAGALMLGIRHGSGTVLALPSSKLLTNISLASRDNAWLVSKLLAEPDRAVEVVGAWTGAGSRNPLEALEKAQLTPWLLQLLLLAVLLAWWKGPHFGAPKESETSSRHAFVEHIQALGFLYARGKASRYALANYGAWALARLHERLSPGARATTTELALALAKLTGREETEVLQILIAARSAHDEAHDTLTPEEHLDTMRELASLLKAAGGTR